MKNLIRTIKQAFTDYVGVSATSVFDRDELTASRDVDITDCNSVCLALGPYRNLTTLTAATLFLHPNCQVLNHAGKRIFGNLEVDFIADYSKERFEQFIQYAIYISREGKGGDKGGSITHSHAFNSHHEMKKLFVESGAKKIKPRINCLFWKESLKTSKRLRAKNINIGYLLDAEKRLRFLMPIRNPMDCTLSNLKTGHAKRFPRINNDSTKLDVLQAILDEIYWFASYQQNYPDRFFSYYQHSISQQMLARLTTFLSLNPDRTWLLMAEQAMVIKSGYSHDGYFLDHYRKSVEQKFSDLPELAEQLLVFAQVQEENPDA